MEDKHTYLHSAPGLGDADQLGCKTSAAVYAMPKINDGLNDVARGMITAFDYARGQLGPETGVPIFAMPKVNDTLTIAPAAGIIASDYARDILGYNPGATICATPKTNETLTIASAARLTTSNYARDMLGNNPDATIFAMPKVNDTLTIAPAAGIIASDYARDILGYNPGATICATPKTNDTLTIASAARLTTFDYARDLLGNNPGATICAMPKVNDTLTIAPAATIIASDYARDILGYNPGATICVTPKTNDTLNIGAMAGIAASHYAQGILGHEIGAAIFAMPKINDGSLKIARGMITTSDLFREALGLDAALLHQNANATNALNFITGSATASDYLRKAFVLGDNRVATTSEFVAALSCEPEELEAASSIIEKTLNHISIDLRNRWRGALFALNPKNPDAARHFCASAREVLNEIFDLLAPDNLVISANANCERTRHGKPTRRAKLEFLLRQTGLRNVPDEHVGNVLSLFDLLNSGTHGRAGKFGLTALWEMRERVEAGILFLSQMR